MNLRASYFEYIYNVVDEYKLYFVNYDADFICGSPDCRRNIVR